MNGARNIKRNNPVNKVVSIDSFTFDVFLLSYWFELAVPKLILSTSTDKPLHFFLALKRVLLGLAV
jgi:hypothetical protein